MYEENFLSIPYLGIGFMIGQVNFILYIPLIVLALLESGETFISKLESLNHQISLKVAGYLRQAFANKAFLEEVRSDLELYIGLYLRLFDVVISQQRLRTNHCSMRCSYSNKF
jgi:hypothetical protein